MMNPVSAGSPQGNEPPASTGASKPTLIPRPLRLKVEDGAFRLSDKTRILAAGSRPETADTANDLAGKLRPATGFPISVVASDVTSARPGDIVLALAGPSPDLGDEGYELSVSPQGVELRAPHPAGLFWGVQTLRQLLPQALERPRPTPGVQWTVPCVRVADTPRYSWRGFMLDCGRHFVSKEGVKRCLDLMAYLKMNRFHWHLTEDQGWRIEIRRYPRLTKVGSRVLDEEQRQGFYTQEDAREIVDYAASRHIMVIPEIEFPGHSLAAMLSYPHLCCSGKPQRNPGHQRDLYCAGNDATFEFVENVLSEVMDVFPATFVHIGGDEAPKERWKECPKCQARIRGEGLKNEEELQGWFTGRIARILAARNRRLIGWEEIATSGYPLPQDAVIHWWRHRTFGSEIAIRAAREGRDVIASPNSYCYLSFPTSPAGQYKMERTIDLPKIHAAEFTPDGLTDEERKHILGGEACMWTENVLEEQIESNAFPRILGIAELLWSPREGKDFAEFFARVKRHYPRLDILNVAHGPAFRHLSEEG